MTEDSSRWPGEDEEEGQLVGETFQRTVTLGANCDSQADVCTVGHETFALYFPEEGYLELQWERTSRSATSMDVRYTEEYEDDCTEADGTVVGSYDTVATFTLTLTQPVTRDGRTVWASARVTFREDSTSPDDCPDSTYAAGGELRRD